MNRIRISAALLAVFLAAQAHAAVILDQDFATTDDPNHSTGLGIVTTGLGQSFTVGVTGLLSAVEFNVLRLNGATTGDLTFDLRSLTGGVPDASSASALGTSIIANGDIGLIGGSPYAWTTVHVDVSGYGINVTAGDELAFILSSPIAQEFTVQTDYLDAYAGGMRWSQNGDGTAFASLATADLAFATYVDDGIAPSAVPLPAGLPLIAAAFGLLGLMRRRS